MCIKSSESDIVKSKILTAWMDKCSFSVSGAKENTFNNLCSALGINRNNMGAKA